MMDKIQAIKIKDLHPFPDNPFKVVDGEELDLLAESIKEYGVISPLLVRPRDGGGYEVIAGHRRLKACELAGIENIPAFVRDMDRDTAIIALVDSNLHREHLLPSEKAFAFKMKFEAIKHQGQRTDLATVQVAPKWSTEIIGEEQGISKDQVKRYIRLTELIPDILTMVDSGQIALSPAVELSFLRVEEQQNLLETMQSEDCTPSHAQAIRMKKLSQENSLDMDAIFTILTEVKPNQQEQIKLKKDSIKRYFPKDYTTKQMEEIIVKLLEQWQRKRQQNRDIR